MTNLKPILTKRILINFSISIGMLFFILMTYFIMKTPPSREKYSHGMDRVALSQQTYTKELPPLSYFSPPVTEKSLNTKLYSATYFIANTQFAKDTIEYCGQNVLSSQNALTNCNNAFNSQNALYQSYVAFNLVSAVDIGKAIIILILAIMVISLFKMLGKEQTVNLNISRERK